MAQLFKNNSKSTLAASLAAAGTSLTVQATHGARFPVLTVADFFMATLQDATNVEIVKVTARSADVFTIVRSQEGTTAPTTFASGAIVSLRMTAAAVESMLNHPTVATGAHAATSISNTPAGTIAATTVQAALNELDSEKTTLTETNTAVSNHVALADPHTQYALDTDLTAGLATKQPLHANLTALSAGNATLAWPIGSVYTSIVATNPATLLGGGTWVGFGAGRVLVGLDATQTEFDLVEEVGGAKTHTLTTAEIPAHTHALIQNVSFARGATSNAISALDYDTQAPAATGAAGGGTAHNNLQPYIVVYFWKRTA